jgi:hypothetical protein
MSAERGRRKMQNNIMQALEAKAITAAEGLTLSHYYSMGRRAASAYTNAQSMALISNIAGRVRESLIKDNGQI